MILPDKNINTTNSLIGIGALLLKNIKSGQTVSSLWEKIKTINEMITFDKYVLGLDLLYGLEAIIYQDGIIRRKNDT